jgi:flagellar hook-associated protein 3 FlgL
MRIATSTLYANSVANMNQQQATIAELNQQIGTGKRVTTPGDDPVAAASAVRVNLQISRNSDLASNRQTVSTSLNAVSTALSSATALMTSIKSELVAAGNGAYDLPQRQFLAKQLQSQMQEMMGYANVQDGNGEYLFSGYKTGTQPYVLGNHVNVGGSSGNAAGVSLSDSGTALTSPFPGTATVTIASYTAGSPPSFTYNVSGLPNASDNVTNAASVNGQISLGGATLTLNGSPAIGDSFVVAPAPTQFQGDSGTRTVEVYEGRQMPINLSGASVFASVPTGNGSFANSAAGGNTGTGLIDGGSVVSSLALTHKPYQLQFTATPSVAITPGNVNQGSATVAASSISGVPVPLDKYQLSFSVAAGGATTYSVLDTTSGASVASNAAYTPGGAISVNGVSFAVTGTPAQGDVLNLGPGPATSYNVIDPGTGTALLSNQTYKSGSAIQFDGMSFSITGAPNYGDQFNVNPSTTTDVFATMQSAIDALNNSGSGAQGSAVLANALSLANAGIDAASNQVEVAQTTVGGRLQELSSLDSSGSQLKLQYQQSLNTLTAVDFTAAVSSLSQAQVALTAAQKSFVQVQNLSLFNFIQ